MAIPGMPIPASAHLYTRMAGATPNVITSASESSSTPNSLCVRVSRATRPSNAAKKVPKKMATHARRLVPLEIVAGDASARGVEQQQPGAAVLDEPVAAQAQLGAHGGDPAPGVAAHHVLLDHQARVDGVEGIAHVLLGIQAGAGDGVVAGGHSRLGDVHAHRTRARNAIAYEQHRVLSVG